MLWAITTNNFFVFIQCYKLAQSQNMEYKKYFRLNAEFTEALKCFAIKHDCVDDSYYVAKSLLSEMNEKAYRDNEFLQIAGKWFNGGMTLELKEALRFTRYEDDDLVHFNAMCLLDSVSACL